MKKSDLKTGMWIQTRNGEFGIILLNTKSGDIISGETWFPLSCVNDDLTASEHFANNDSDIMKIFQPTCNKNYLDFSTKTFKDINEFCLKHSFDLIWERTNSIKEMTIEEIQNKLGHKIKIIES